MRATAVVGLAGDEPLVVAAEIAGEAQAAPIAAAVREVVELVNVVAAAVEDHADAAVGHLADAAAHALAPAFVAGRFGIGIAPHAAAVVMVVAVRGRPAGRSPAGRPSLGPTCAAW